VLHQAPIARQYSLPLTHDRSINFWHLQGPPGAPTVLLLHGIAVTAGLNWGPSFAILGRHFQVVAPDLRGHGHGASPSADFRLEDCADDAVVLADALGIDRFIAAGYSMGSLVAQLLWRRHPSRVAGLVLCASSRNFRGTAPERMASLLTPAVTFATRMNPLVSVLGAGMLAPGLLNGLYGASRQFALAEMNQTSMTTVTAAIVAVSEFTSHDWIGEVDVPVSVLITTDDKIVPTARQYRLAQSIPHATVITIDGDHGVCVRDPELFSQKLLQACLAVRSTV
jgi:3-oxoadipate enol-lactonase